MVHQNKLALSQEVSDSLQGKDWQKVLEDNVWRPT